MHSATNNGGYHKPQGISQEMPQDISHAAAEAVSDLARDAVPGLAADIEADIEAGIEADIAAGERHLLDRIRHLLAWQFGVDAAAIEAQTELVDHLYADSLDLMEMTHILNREFDIDIEPEQLADMHTVGGVERVVKAMLLDGDAAPLRN
ncbi:MAG TPA: phosphopantetheine-binding protein [Herbaspirillum sp.]